MAILKRSKASVYQLPEDLAALAAADSAETTARIAGDATLTTNLESEVTRATAAEAAELARATAAEGVLQTNITAEETRALAAEAALSARIDNVLDNSDPAAIDSLREIVDAYTAADSSLNGAITTLAQSAGTGLSDEIARATAAEGVLTTNLATEVAARIAADSALDTSLKAYADEAVRVGGAVPEQEMLTVTDNKIVLTNAPKNGVKGIMNFGRVSYVDNNNVENLAPVSLDATDASGKTFIVSVDVSGEWNTKQVAVQYWYIAAA